MGPFASVLGNIKSEGSEPVAFSVALQAVKLVEAARDRVVAIAAVGFGRAFGGGSKGLPAA